MSGRRKIFDLFEEQKDFVDAKVAEGIEKYRKGDATVTVVDGQGNPVFGAQIRVNQKSHEFRFGANIFMLDELETPEKNEIYKRHFAGESVSAFNFYSFFMACGILPASCAPVAGKRSAKGLWFCVRQAAPFPFALSAW